jgi:uncharacterized protein YkwD
MTTSTPTTSFRGLLAVLPSPSVLAVLVLLGAAGCDTTGTVGDGRSFTIVGAGGTPAVAPGPGSDNGATGPGLSPGTPGSTGTGTSAGGSDPGNSASGGGTTGTDPGSATGGATGGGSTGQTGGNGTAGGAGSTGSGSDPGQGTDPNGAGSAPAPSPTDRLCAPCSGDGQCGDAANICLRGPSGETFCGRDCSTGGCPTGYTCQGIGDGSGNVVASQCVPDSLSCQDGAPAGGTGSTPPGGTGGTGGTGGSSGGAGAPVPPTADISQQEQHLLALVNADRAASGRSCAQPLQLHAGASTVARGHSQWMAQTGTLAHDDPNGDPFTRLQNAGVAFSGAGENAACGGGCQSVDQAEQLFMSEGPGGGHYENVLNCDWTHVGIGVAVDANGGVWVTQDFLRL